MHKKIMAALLAVLMILTFTIPAIAAKPVIIPRQIELEGGDTPLLFSYKPREHRLTVENKIPQSSDSIMMEKLEVYPFLSQDKNIADIQLALYSNWANDGLLFFTLGDAVRSGRIHHLTIHGYNADRETSYTSYFDFVRTPDGHLDSCRPVGGDASFQCQIFYDLAGKIRLIQERNIQGQIISYNLYYGKDKKLKTVNISASARRSILIPSIELARISLTRDALGNLIRTEIIPVDDEGNDYNASALHSRNIHVFEYDPVSHELVRSVQQVDRGGNRIRTMNTYNIHHGADGSISELEYAYRYEYQTI